ncbi:MAG: ABC transporter ATP-binding protein [Halobacteriaceae archaeon]
MAIANRLLGNLLPSRKNLLRAGIIINTEIILILVYLLVVDVTPTAIRFYAYPFIWINVSLWALTRVSVPDISQFRGIIAGGIAIIYFFILGAVGGLYSLGGNGLGLRIVLFDIPPGWGPALLYSGTWITVSLLPFKLIGYATLAFLVFVTIGNTPRSALSGVIGFFSCISCTWPVVAMVITSLFGSASIIASVAMDQTYALSTSIFVIAILLLTWQPEISAKLETYLPS